jgi:hypothetical protein
MRKFSLGALVAAGLLAGGLSAGSASAADLGGNCCADLEERIAELEATTARKGNRKVSLTVSGWVGEQVMWWDDGAEQNVYVTGLGSTLASHFKFTGQATISPGWYAGYVIHVEANDSDSLTINQISQHNASALGANGAFAVQLLQSFWFIKSDHLGKLSVGLQSSASDNAAILVDGSGSLVPANWVMFDYNSFQTRRKDTGALTGLNIQQFGGFCQNGGGAGGDCFGAPRDSIRYDSPTFGGFSVSASWGEDDFWDVAARYAGEFNGFKVAAAAAYSVWTEDFAGATPLIPEFETKYFQAGLYVEHVPTGLFAYGAYGHIDPEGNAVGAIANIARKDGDTWYGKLGLRERWTPLGHTVLYGEYAQYEDSFTDALLQLGVTGGDTTLWGLGVVQEIDAAAMSLFLSYRNVEVDVQGTGANFTGAGLGNLDDFQYVKGGALINF